MDSLKEENRQEIRARALRYSEASIEYTSRDERDRLMSDWEKKGPLADGVVKDFRVRAVEPRGKKLLEIGFGNGVQLAAFAAAGAQMSGLEVNPVLRDLDAEEVKGMHVDLQVYDGAHFPFPDASFEGAYSISVLEHASDPQVLLSEAARMLVPGGLLYLAFPNRWWPLETHTKIWFLSYLPLPSARNLLLLFGRNTIDELNLHFIGYLQAKKMLADAGFVIRYEDNRGAFPQRLLKRFLRILGLHHSAILPHVMVVAERKSETL